MKKEYPYLTDIPFLNLIYGQNNQTTYVEITCLDWYERPLQRIEGRVINASINLNGDSAVRRTANLTIKILDNLELYTNIDSLFSINKKIFIETGLKNQYAHLGDNYYKDYPTIWFPFGVFVITGCSVTHDITGVTVNLTLNDKMCLLNGTSGGVIPASTNFESYDTIGPDGDYHSEYIRINQIIPELVNHFGGEDLNNIVVMDIPNRIKQVVRWLGSNPLYLFQNKENIKNSFYTTINTQNDSSHKKSTFTYGYDCGYYYTDFIYPGELAAGPGDTVCSVLDKIKQTLGNYEYYYDIFGTFIFQEIKNYENTTEWRTAFREYQDGSDIALPYAYNRILNSNVYNFSDNNFIISYNNTPKFDMIKNDFVVWGTREGTSGLKVPCRYHLAIDNRPQPLTENWNVCANFPEGICFDTDMTDYIRRAFPITASYKNLDQLKEVTGIVGKYYYVENDGVYSYITDIEKYNNKVENYRSAAQPISDAKTHIETVSTPIAGYVKLPYATYYPKNNSNFTVKSNTDWRNILYWQGLIASVEGTDTGYYYAELYNEWPKIYDIENNKYYEDMISAPSALDWWLDIIDSNAIFNQFSVNNIGRRSYAKTETSCNCVFETVIPDIVMVDLNDQGQIIDSRTTVTKAELEEQGLIPVQVQPSIINSSGTGGILNSCYETVKQMINQYTDYNETISITSIPIYHLEPNTRVHVEDPESGIYGDYLINTISYTLGNSGTMNLSLTKIVQKI